MKEVTVGIKDDEYQDLLVSGYGFAMVSYSPYSTTFLIIKDVKDIPSVLEQDGTPVHPMWDLPDMIDLNYDGNTELRIATWREDGVFTDEFTFRERK